MLPGTVRSRSSRFVTLKDGFVNLSSGEGLHIPPYPRARDAAPRIKSEGPGWRKNEKKNKEAVTSALWFTVDWAVWRARRVLKFPGLDRASRELLRSDLSFHLSVFMLLFGAEAPIVWPYDPKS